MSNLATMIMEGSGIGSFGKANLKHSYDHENGAGLIAMESAEALRDIFEAEFYVPNTCTIAAALEGASCVEESSQAAIMEASVKGAFERIKKFFSDLKAKVLEFLHQIKRFLLGIFASDKKWIKDYKKDLEKLSDNDLKGYEVKMYEYDPKKMMALNKLEIAAYQDDLMAKTKLWITMADDAVKSDRHLDESDMDDKFNDKYESELKKLFDTTDPDEIQSAAWSKMRSGAKSADDKKTISIGRTQISEYIKAIENAEADVKSFDDSITTVSKSYTKCINFINDCANKVDNAKVVGTNISGHDIKEIDRKSIGLSEKDDSGSTNRRMGSNAAQSYATALRKMSAYTSKMQTANNAVFTAAKTALQERNREYKKVLVGAFGYARKHKGGK